MPSTMGQCRWFAVLLVLVCFTLGRTEDSMTTCRDADSCMAIHTNQTTLVQMLKHRCQFDNHGTPGKRRITFTHIPKAGGSSIRDFFTTNAKDRIRPIAHENFYISYHEEPNNIFVTRIREPIARAISFHAYVNERPVLSKVQKENKLWVATFKKSPTDWAADPFIQRTLFQDPLGLFLREVDNITDSIAYFDVKKMRAMPDAHYKDVVPGTLPEFRNYAQALPKPYQCQQHLEVAYMLLKQYEVVGTLEKDDDFFKVLARRAGLPKQHAEEGKAIHTNKSVPRATEAEKALVREHLQGPLFCGIMLWRIAGLISDADTACVGTGRTDRAV